jgi:PAS domain S-box-containing protein
MGMEHKPSTREQFRAILEHIVDGVVVQDMNAEIVYLNPAAAKMLRFDSQEQALKAGVDRILSGFELTDERGRPFPKEQLPGREALKGKPEPVRVVRVGVHEDGVKRWRWAWVKASPIFDERQGMEFVVTVFQEITAMKQAELGLKDANQRITRLLEEVLETSERN